MKNIGHCPHGEFSILEGCQKCMAETFINAKKVMDGDTSAVADLIKAVNLPSCIAETFSPENNELKEQVKIVADKRREAQEVAEIKKLSLMEWEIQHKDLIDGAVQTAQAVTDAEAKLRELTLKAYSETGSKSPAEGVSVKIFQTLDYDPKEALKWALHHQIALSLDKKSFEGLAKASNIEFVSITDEPRAQIATNLDEYVK